MKVIVNRLAMALAWYYIVFPGLSIRPLRGKIAPGDSKKLHVSTHIAAAIHLPSFIINGIPNSRRGTAHV
jgi:hypothetical protein